MQRRRRLPAAARVDVSAAFFVSREFKETGSYVYRLYQGALGRQLSYAEFASDRQQVVGGPNLEASKAAFANAFVSRAEFVAEVSGKHERRIVCRCLIAIVGQYERCGSVQRAREFDWSLQFRQHDE